MTQLPTQITQELSYSRTQPTQVLHDSLARQAKGLCQNNWHVLYHQFPLLFLCSVPKEAHIRLGGKKKCKANVFTAVGIAFVWNAFKGSRSSSQHFSCIYAYFLSSHWPLPTLLNAPPPPLKPYKKLLFFLSQLLTEAYSTAESKRSKAHAGCLSPGEDCIFYLSPLGFIFTVNSWLKCNQPRNPPYVHSCHSSSPANRIKCKQKGKKKI